VTQITRSRLNGQRSIDWARGSWQATSSPSSLTAKFTSKPEGIQESICWTSDSLISPRFRSRSKTFLCRSDGRAERPSQTLKQPADN
jgi:hypothetical protein